jgi:HEAT repeat protein
LSYLLGRRSAVDALNRILRDDPDPYVRAATVVSVRNCKTPPAFATLWRAAKSDPDSYVRAQAYQTLDRFGQLHTRDDLLAASRTQTDAGSAGRLSGPVA